jgi:hypothetical protein
VIKDTWAKQKVGHRQLLGDCCFVLLKEPQAAQQAISLNASELKGNTLRVDWANGNLLETINAREGNVIKAREETELIPE